MGKRLSLAIVALVALAMLACSLTGGPTEEETAEATQPPPTERPAETSTSPAEPDEEEMEGEEETDSLLRAADGMEMVHIPAGEFLMGNDKAPVPTQRPEHVVYLDAYWVDRLEVSNAQYRLCVEAGVCSEPRSWKDVNFNGDQQPAIVVWDDADAYCAWVGGRLPTEAEWEKAARGTDGRTWVWGNTFEGTPANLSGEADGYGFTAPVGSFPSDVSPYGVLDMAGNAAEWASDWWDEDYYVSSPDRNPTGPASGEMKVHRAPIAHAGGGPAKSTCTVRYAARPSEMYGFRCVSTTAPAQETPPSSSDESPDVSGEEGEAGEGDEGSGGSTAEGWPPLQSYRIRTVMTLPEEDVPEDAEGPVEQVSIFEWSGAEPASRMVVACLEEVTVGDTRWTKMRDNPWSEETLTAEEQAAWEQQWGFAQFWGMDEDLAAALPDGVAMVPGQIFPTAVKAAMVPDGEETVNGVRCRRYTVDADLDYTNELGHTTGHAQGTIWVADQEGIPPVVVRALMDEDLAIDGEPRHPSWEHNITDINQPVSIETPE